MERKAATLNPTYEAVWPKLKEGDMSIPLAIGRSPDFTHAVEWEQKSGAD